jgi:ABC-type bacteriocin/lantibiotic exporter with double-glycine peptidase domain
MMRDTFLKMNVEYFSERKMLLLLAGMGLLSIPLQEVLVPHSIGVLVNSYVSKLPQSATHVSIAMVIGSLLLAQSAIWLTDWVEATMIPEFGMLVRSRMLEKIMGGLTDATGSTADLPTGELIALMSRVPDTFSSMMDNIKGMMPHLLMLFASTIYVATYDLGLAAMLALSIVIMMMVLARNVSACVQKTVAREKVFNDMHEYIDDLLNNVPSVVTNDMTREETANLYKRGEQFIQAFYANQMCTTNVKIFMIPIAVVLFSAIIWRSNRLIFDNKMSIGTFVSIITICMYTLMSTLRILHWSKHYVYDWGVMMGASDIFSRTSIPTRHAPTTDCPSVMCLRDVGFRTEQRTIIRDTNLTANAGDRIAIIGPIGSGKSTMLKLIAGIMPPSHGEISFDRSKYGVAYIPQRATLFNRSVYENVVYKAPSVTKKEVWEVATSLGVAPLLKGLSNGLDTMVGKNGSAVSGGQRQVIMFLRALVTYRDATANVIVLMDEPTASLDPKSRDIVARAIRNYPAACVIFVTHDMKLVSESSNRVLQLQGHKTT